MYFCKFKRKKKAFLHFEIFIRYMGHGSGSQFYPVDDVQKNSSRLCVLLMGCSSARLQSLGDFEVFGMPFAYLTCGAYVFIYIYI